MPKEGVSPIDSEWERIAKELKSRIELMNQEIEFIRKASMFVRSYEGIHNREKADPSLPGMTYGYKALIEHPDVAFLISLQKIKSSLEDAIKTRGKSLEAGHGL